MDAVWVLGFAELLTLGLVAFLLWRNHLKSDDVDHALEHALEQAEAEMDLQRSALDFTEFLKDWNDTHFELMQLFRDTEIDRFLILRAWNGKLDPRWTTAVFQMREEGQQVMQYVHVELDQDYAERLKQMANKGTIWFVTDHINDCAIKDIYQAEGVTASVWSHIETKDAGETSAVTFCSFATHSEEGLTDSTVTRCKVLAGRLKSVAGVFGE